MTDYKEVRTTQNESGREQRVATFKATQLIWLLLGILEAAIALRVVFKLIAVNAANPFAALLYSVTDLFVAPFASLIGAPAVWRHGVGNFFHHCHDRVLSDRLGT